ncbi:MAG: hypothetical protein A3H35_04180 [Betaproteobacteria bacterium RIFCSPLOWO2_02_FULL_62_17]|nr:MAG: hypothetical protein A3H35_04180 [Betaproteobacteria bacterium RIFCSPLOWO2_02_FULL_62_17]
MAGNGKVTGYTHKGTKWEYQQSWYLLALFTIWFYWFPLVYTGLRTLQFRWIVYGLLYGLPALIQMFFNMADLGVAGFFRNWEIAALVIAAIHSLRARGEYLVRLANNAERHDLLMEGARLLKQEVEQATGIRIEELQEEVPVRADAPETATQPAAPKPARRLFDVNLIGERELAMLPGMGPARARETMAMRQSLGGFHSFDHFAEKMGLAAEARERLRPIFIQPAPAAESNAEYTVALDGRRILEINLASAQAIATLPGLDHDIARRAVALRDGDGPYKSVEDFRYRLGLSLDVVVQISPIVSTLKTPVTLAAGVKANARVVDASASGRSDPAAAVKPSGRIVDL